MTAAVASLKPALERAKADQDMSLAGAPYKGRFKDPEPRRSYMHTKPLDERTCILALSIRCSAFRPGLYHRLSFHLYAAGGPFPFPKATLTERRYIAEPKLDGQRAQVHIRK